MGKLTKEDIFRIVDEEDVAFIRLQFCDIFGTPKNIAITERQLKDALENNCMFDGSAIEGFGRAAESDMYLYPDIDSFQIYPWRPQSGKVARMFCDVYTSDRKPFVSDSRSVLRKVLGEAREMGLTFKADPEFEFFLFELDDEGQPTTKTHETAGYFDLAPADQGENVRRDIIMNLEDLDFNITSSHHEISPAQHEIDFTEDDAARMADMIMTFKMAVKTIAKRHGLYATFMPKPKEGMNGSGMHIKILCEDSEGRDVFGNPDGEGLSETAKQFIAGLLEHIKGMTLVTNPLVNSYKRLVPGYDAPVNLTWSAESTNHSSLIRIPSPGKTGYAVELRNPDATCNPYLTLALILAAGMDGIKRGLTPPDSLGENLKDKTDEEIRDAKFEVLPKTLGDAIEAYLADDFVKEVLGETIYKQYLEAKRREWKEFCNCVTQWELKAYLGNQ